MLVRLLIACFLTGAFAAPAAAQVVEPLPGRSWVLPADNAVRTATSWPAATPFETFEFTLYVDAYGTGEEVYPFDIEVSASPALDPDGTLADANRIDSYVAPPRPGAPEIFSVRAAVTSRWLSIPGTYYWQAHYTEDDELYATPLHRLTIAPRPEPDTTPPVPPPPPPPIAAPATVVPAPLPASTVRTIVRRAIASATRRSPRRLLYRCVSVPGGNSTCLPSWRDTRSSYRGTLRISSGLNGIHAAFTGTATLRACARRCARASEWSTSL